MCVCVIRDFFLQKKYELEIFFPVHPFHSVLSSRGLEKREKI